jgi:hypothetical protein
LSDLASKALAPSAVRDDPTIHACHNPEEKSDKENQANSVKRLFRNNRNEDRGDILIRGLWSHGTDCIIDVRITDVDAKSNRSKDSDKVLEAHQREKRRNASGPASSNVSTFPHSWCQRMFSSVKKPRSC